MQNFTCWKSVSTHDPDLDIYQMSFYTAEL
jgi:hypothetical protein